MYEIIEIIHRYWGMLTLLVLFLATANALVKTFTGSSFADRDFRISLFALITMHIQLLIGLVLYFVHPNTGLAAFRNIGVGEVMKSSELRLLAVEHPVAMLLAVILVTVGYSRHKKIGPSKGKFRAIGLFYLLALLLLVIRVPWEHLFRDLGWM